MLEFVLVEYFQSFFCAYTSEIHQLEALEIIVEVDFIEDVGVDQCFLEHLIQSDEQFEVNVVSEHSF